jgi:hypothetical protein
MTDTTNPPAAAPATTPAPAATPAPEASAAAVPEVDDFAAAFAELQTAADAPPVKTDPPAAAPAPAPSPAPAPAPSPAPAGDPVPVEPSPAPTPTPVPEGFISRADFDRILNERLEAMKPAAAPAPAPTPAPAPAPLLSADEQAVLAKYEQDWDQVSLGEALKRRVEYNALVNHIFKQLEPVITAVNQISGNVGRVESSVQLRELEDLIPDYHEVREPVLDWVAKQPAYLKTAYEQLTASGSPEEIADMVDRFRKETGWVAPAGTPAPTPAATSAAAPAAAAPTPTPAPAPAPTAALPAAAAAAVASLKPVKSGRTEPAQAQDPNDFDGAWKEFTAA